MREKNNVIVPLAGISPCSKTIRNMGIKYRKLQRVKCLILYNKPTTLLSVFVSSLIRAFQFNLLSSIIPRYFVDDDSNNLVWCRFNDMRFRILYLGGLNTRNSVFLAFKDSLFAHNQLGRRVAVVKGVGRRTYCDNCVGQHLSGAGSSPVGSVGRDLNLQKLNYQYLTTSVAVVLVVRWYFNG